MTDMIDRACLAAWPDYETVTDEMRSRMRAAIAGGVGGEMKAEIRALREERDRAGAERDALRIYHVELEAEIAALKAERDKLKDLVLEHENGLMALGHENVKLRAAAKALEGK